MAIISRLKLDHPALGTSGGASLHTAIQNMYKKIGDNMADRIFFVNDLADTESVDLDHNFNTAVGNLRYDLYLWNDTTNLLVRITATSTPSLSDFGLIPKVGDELKQFTLTNNSGVTRDLALVVLQDPINLSELVDVSLGTVPEDGQALVYDAVAGEWVAGASGDASFKIQGVTASNAAIKGGYIIASDGKELATYSGSGNTLSSYGVDLSLNLNTILGGSPADSANYYLYIDLNTLPAAQVITDTGRKVYRVVQSNFFLTQLPPDHESANPNRYLPIGVIRSATTGSVWVGDGSAFSTIASKNHYNGPAWDQTVAPEDGQALVFSSLNGKYKPGASGDSSFKVQSVATPNATIKGGYLLLDSGIQLSTNGDGTDLTVNLTTILGSAPADASVYELYVDLNTVGAPVAEASGRMTVAVGQANFALSLLKPSEINQGRYVPIGFIRSATTGNVWSGAGASFGTHATRRHDISPVTVSPLAQTIGPLVIGAVGDVDNLAGGHVLNAASFPAGALDTAKLSFYGLTNVNDGFHTRILANNGGILFNGTSIRGVAASVANLDGTNDNFSSTDAFFTPAANESFAFGGWIAATDWTPANNQTLISKWDGTGNQRGYSLQFGASGNIVLIVSTDGTSVAQITIEVANPGFQDGSWHHLAGVYDANTDTLSLYIDGVKAGSAIVSAIHPSTAPYRIGALGSGGVAANFLAGRVQEVFAVDNYLLSDEDIRKLASVRLDISAPVLPENMELKASHIRLDGSIRNDFDSGWLLDKRNGSIYVDFGGPSVNSVVIKLFDQGISTRSISTKDKRLVFTSNPNGTVAHGLPELPTGIALLHDELADGRYAVLNPYNHVKADATNLYLSGFDSLLVDGTHPVILIASVAPIALAADKKSLDNFVPNVVEVTGARTAVNGDFVILKTGAGTQTLPATPAVGAMVTFVDGGIGLLANNVTVARNGQLINGAASDFTLDVDNAIAKFVFVGGTRGWQVF